MDIPFKNFIQRGEKYIVVENGKPEYVMMHYEDYQELIQLRDGEARAAKAPEPVPQNFSREAVLSGVQFPDDISKVRLEDLPL